VSTNRMTSSHAETFVASLRQPLQKSRRERAEADRRRRKWHAGRTLGVPAPNQALQPTATRFVSSYFRD